MKKIISILFVALMVLVPLSACGNSGKKENLTSSANTSQAGEAAESKEEVKTEEINFDEDPYKLVVCYPVFSEAQADLKLIQEAVNKITLQEINATVEFEAVGLFSMANVYNLKASSQEQVDLMMLMPGTNYLASFVTSNMIRPIGEEIDKWGPSIQEILGGSLNAGIFNGEQYAVPQNRDYFVNGYGYQLLQSVCDDNNIDSSKIKTLDDLEAAFEIVKQNEPDKIVIVPEQSNGTIVTSLLGKIDVLGTSNNIAALRVTEDNKLEAEFLLERPEYKTALKKVREWYEKGYISPDVNTTQESGSQLQWAGRAFASATAGIGAAMGDITNGIERTSIMFDDSSLLRTTGDDQLQIWTVSSRCKRPDKAVQFLNLAFENADIGNIFRYGIEDNHYKKMDNGAVEMTNTGGWQNNWYSLGDYNKIYVRNDVLITAGDISLDEFQTLRNEWNDRVKTSPAYGFTFDPSAVKNEISSCDVVTNEYATALGNGTLDPEVELPVYIEKMKNAGVQKIIDEVQRQLDEWVANNQ